MTTATDIIARAAYLLNDTGYVTWSQAAHLAAFNEARRIAAQARPDLYQTTVVQRLLPGARQLLPADAIRLTEITRNVCGPAITLVERGLLDRFNPGWTVGTRSQVVQHYTSDERDPNIYWVYPPACPPSTGLTGSISGAVLTVTAVDSGGTLGQGQVIEGTDIVDGTTITGKLTGTGGVGTYSLNTSYEDPVSSRDLIASGAEVQMIHEVAPVDYTLTSTLTKLEEFYAPAWVDFVCQRAWMVDVEVAGSVQQAQAFGQLFMQAFGVGQAARLAVAPDQNQE
jgi:hypothetical protein